MIHQGEARAVWNLLAYNLAFIVPLVIVFVPSYTGLRSETLGHFTCNEGRGYKLQNCGESTASLGD